MKYELYHNIGPLRSILKDLESKSQGGGRIYHPLCNVGLNVINGELLKTNITTSSEKLQTLDIIPYTLALDTFKTVHKVLHFTENCIQ